MSDALDISITGAQAVQAAAVQALAALTPAGAFGRAVQHATAGAHRYAVIHTVVDTGAWRAAHRPEMRGLTGRVFVDSEATNPRSGSLPSIYGPALEKNRGGRYAVYKNTVEQAGPGLLQEAGAIIVKALP